MEQIKTQIKTQENIITNIINKINERRNQNISKIDGEIKALTKKLNNTRNPTEAAKLGDSIGKLRNKITRTNIFYDDIIAGKTPDPSTFGSVNSEVSPFIDDLMNAINTIQVLSSEVPIVKKPVIGTVLKNIVKKLYTIQNPHEDISKIENEIIGYSKILSSGMENGQKITNIRRAELIDLINKGKDSLMSRGKNGEIPGRIFSPKRTLQSMAGVGAWAGAAAYEQEKNKDINAIKQGLNPWTSLKRGRIASLFDALGVTTNALLAPYTITRDTTKSLLNFLSVIKTPDQFQELFKRLSNAPLDVRKQVISKLSWKIRAKYFIYERTKRTKELIDKMTNLSPSTKVGLGIVGAAGAALAAKEIKRQIELNQAKVYGCDTIEDPTKKLQCEIMVAKENLKEYKKFLSKCYDSNNPESCVKIYSQKMKDEDAKLAGLMNQLNQTNAQVNPKSIATTPVKTKRPAVKKSVKTPASKEHKRLN